MGALGAALASQGGGPSPPSGAEAGGPGMGQAGQAADAQLQLLQQGMGRVRDIGEDVKLIAQQFPEAAATAQQIQQLLKQLIIEMAPMAPAQTGSSLAVPGGGQAP